VYHDNAPKSWQGEARAIEARVVGQELSH